MTELSTSFNPDRRYLADGPDRKIVHHVVRGWELFVPIDEQFIHRIIRANGPDIDGNVNEFVVTGAGDSGIGIVTRRNSIYMGENTASQALMIGEIMDLPVDQIDKGPEGVARTKALVFDEWVPQSQ